MFDLQGKYHQCPPQIFLKFSGLQDSGTERYESPKLAAKIHFYYHKKSILNQKKRNNTKPIMISCRTPIISAYKTDVLRLLRYLQLSPRYWQIFVVYIFVQFLTLFLSQKKKCILAGSFGMSIFPYNYFKVLKVSRKSEAAS